MTEQIEDKRTTDFKIWNGSEWVSTRGLVSESLLCARPGCFNKPHKSATTGHKKWCSIHCRTLHKRQLEAKGEITYHSKGSGKKLTWQGWLNKFLD